MQDIAQEVVFIADACLGGLQGRSALLIGPDIQSHPYLQHLRHARMKNIFQEDTPARISTLLPLVQLVINVPAIATPEDNTQSTSLITAGSIAKGCEGRRTPLLIFDLAQSSSVEELAGLLPAVCLYTPEDLRRILAKLEMKAS